MSPDGYQIIVLQLPAAVNGKGEFWAAIWLIFLEILLRGVYSCGIINGQASPQSPLKLGTPSCGHPSPAPLRLLSKPNPLTLGFGLGCGFAAEKTIL